MCCSAVGISSANEPTGRKREQRADPRRRLNEAEPQRCPTVPPSVLLPAHRCTSTGTGVNSASPNHAHRFLTRRRCDTNKMNRRTVGRIGRQGKPLRLTYVYQTRTRGLPLHRDTWPLLNSHSDSSIMSLKSPRIWRFHCACNESASILKLTYKPVEMHLNHIYI